MRYFLLRSNRESGPFYIQELKDMSLYPTDMVREEEDATTWVNAREVDNLKSFINYSDRLTAFDSEIRSSDTNLKYRSNYEAQRPDIDPRKRNSVLFRLLFTVGIAAVLMAGIWIGNKKSERKEEPIAMHPKSSESDIIIPIGAADSLQEDIKAAQAKKLADSIWLEKRKPKNLIKLISLEANDYKVKILGGINNLKLTVENNSDVLLNDITIQVDYLKPNDEVVHTETILAKNIKPMDSEIFDVPSHSRGVKVKYRVISLNGDAIEATEEI